MVQTFLLCFLFCLLLLGCAPWGIGSVLKIDPTSFMIDPKNDREAIHPVCKTLYESSIPKIAVTPFSNNTTFDYAKDIQAYVSGGSQYQQQGRTITNVRPSVGVVWKNEDRIRFQEDTRMTQLEMNSKLGESIEEGVMDQIKALGSVQVYSRRELAKTFDELKLQQSGLFDNTTAVKLGKLVGVRYIVTGSFNNIAISYKSLESLRRGSQDIGNKTGQQLDGWGGVAAVIIGAAGAVAAEAAEGWKIESEVMVRILDVETGEVLFSKQLVGKENIGKMRYPGFAEVVGGVKKAAAKDLPTLKPALARYFTTKGYIYQTKTSVDGKTKIALINLGKINGLREGSQLVAYTFQGVEDPIAGKYTCDQSRLPVILRVSEQLQVDKCWVIVEGTPQSVRKVNVGQLVEAKQNPN